MKSALYNPDCDSLRDTETVADATRHMLQRRVSDLPVVAPETGKLVGMVSTRDMLSVLHEVESR